MKNFDWAAFEAKKLVYNARTEEDARAFLAECEKRGLKWTDGNLPTEITEWEHHREETCFYYGIKKPDRLTYGTGERARREGITICSDPWSAPKESVVELLRRLNKRRCVATCAMCREVLGDHGACPDERECDEPWGKLADMVEAELEEAKRDHEGCAPLPRWADTGEPVKEGDPYGDTTVSTVRVYGNGDWCIVMDDGTELDGVRKERVERVEPDTQERIDEDARKLLYDYWRCEGHLCRDCPAKIDGKTPSKHFKVDGCEKAMLLDLLRRQRELDARMAGDAS